MSDIHIQWTKIDGYMARVHRPGSKKWDCLEKRATLVESMHDMAEQMATGTFNRADIIMCPPLDDYYAPSVLYRMHVARGEC